MRNNAVADWPWPEDTITYANGVIPHALVVPRRPLADGLETGGVGLRLEERERFLDVGAAALPVLLDNREGAVARGVDRGTLLGRRLGRRQCIVDRGRD